MTMNQAKSIDFEEGWDFVQQRINRLKRIVEEQKTPFSAEENMMLYTNIYNMCHNEPTSYPRQLYAKYKETLNEYINSTVLPALREKNDGELMLNELVKRWSNYKRMVKLLIHFFHYLESSFALQTPRDLNDAGRKCFHDLVYQELHGKAISTVIALIEKEREGEQIDRALLKNVCEIFLELGNRTLVYYVHAFENAVLRDTSAYYSRKASTWIAEYSYPDYMLKVEECLKNEKDRASHYLHVSSERKLLWKVKNELLVVYTDQLLEKERSGSRALLTDDKKVKNELLVAYTDELLEKERSGSRALLTDDKKVKNELSVAYTDQLLEKECSGSRALLTDDDKAESSGSSAIIP